MHHPNIRLRPASIADLSILLDWDKQQHVIDSDLDGNWNWETELLHEPPWREQFMAELDGRPLGFVQIIDPAEEETHYWGDDGMPYADLQALPANQTSSDPIPSTTTSGKR